VAFRLFESRRREPIAGDTAADVARSRATVRTSPDQMKAVEKN